MDNEHKKQAAVIITAIGIMLFAMLLALGSFFCLTIYEVRNVKETLTQQEAPVKVAEATAPVSMSVETGKTRWFSGGPHLKEYKLVSVDGGFNWAPVRVSANGEITEFLVPSAVAKNPELKAHFDQLLKMKEHMHKNHITGMRGMTK